MNGLKEVKIAAERFSNELNDTKKYTEAAMELLDILAKKVDALTPVEKEMLREAMIQQGKKGKRKK